MCIYISSFQGLSLYKCKAGVIFIMLQLNRIPLWETTQPWGQSDDNLVGVNDETLRGVVPKHRGDGSTAEQEKRREIWFYSWGRESRQGSPESRGNHVAASEHFQRWRDNEAACSLTSDVHKITSLHGNLRFPLHKANCQPLFEKYISTYSRRKSI